MELNLKLTDARSIRRAAQKVREYQNRFQKKQEEFLRRLSEEGLEVIQARFDTAIDGYDGNASIRVEAVQDGCTVELIASGKAVAFVEFGAGVAHPEHSSGLFQHGTYGKGYGKRKVWGFYTSDGSLQLTTGNDPAEAFPAAVQHIAEVYADIAREVFGSHE